MMPGTGTDLVRLLRALALLEPEPLDVVAALAGQFTDPKALARVLVQRGWLTPFQVNQIFRGRAADLVLGPYILLERLGEGGMGQVFKARHAPLNRIVAVKLIKPEFLARPEAVKRFRREVQAAAQLNHPNIVVAYDATEARGAHFFVMEFVAGIDLGRLVQQQAPRPPAEACAYVGQAAAGLQHAHDKGLVHRDVKPSNLLRTANGVIKVLDLGLARLQTPGPQDPSALTEAGTVMGTPDYIAPEQARDFSAADHRADLYSLGCTLFFLLAGRTPFGGRTVGDKLYRHWFEEPPDLRALRPDVPPTVAAVVRRLLAKRPEDRYPTAAALEEALAVAGVARPGGSSATFSLPELPVPRRPRRGLPVGRVALAVGLLGAAVLLGAWLLRRPPAPPPETVADGDPVAAALADFQRRADDPTVDAERLRQDVLAFGREHAGAFGALQAGELLRRLPSPFDQLTRDRVPVAELAAAGGGDPRQAPADLVGVVGDGRFNLWHQVEAVALSPDGTTLAAAGQDRRITLWDAATGRLRQTLPGHDGTPVFGLAYSPDGRLLASAGSDFTARLWDAATGRELRVLRGHGTTAPGNVVAGVAFSPDGRTLATAGEDRTIRLWDADTGAAGAVLATEHKNVIERLAFTPDGRRLATGAHDGLVLLHDLAGRQPSRRLAVAGKDIRGLAYTADGRHLAFATQERLELLDAASGAVVRTFKPGIAIFSLAFAPGRGLLAAGHMGEVTLWDATNGQLLRSLAVPGPLAHFRALAFTADGRQLAGGDNGGSVAKWDADTGAPLVPPRAVRSTGSSLALASGKRLLATGSYSNAVFLWDPVTGQKLRTLKQPGTYYVTGVAVRWDGGLVASSGYETDVHLWDPDGRREYHPLKLSGHLLLPAFRADGRVLAVGTVEGAAALWDVAAARRLHAWQPVGDGRRLSAIALSPDGRLLATGRADGQVSLWDTAAAQTVRTWSAAPSAIHGLAFRPDGTELATLGYYERQVKLWDVATGRERRSLAWNERMVRHAMYSPDGRWLATAADDGAVRLWEAATGVERRAWQLGPPGVSASGLAFAADSRHLLTSNPNGTVYILRLQTAGGTVD